MDFIARLAEHVYHPLRINEKDEDIVNMLNPGVKKKLPKTKEQKEKEEFMNLVNERLEVKIY